jgi:DNA-binding transcriptional regulator YhcF (GntR family)
MSSGLDTGEIVCLYVDKEWSVRDIATRYGCAYSRIYNILRSRVVMRPSGGRGTRSTTEYIEIAQIIRERITTGDWKPGHKILAQHELAQIFGVRHQTIREAVTHLRQRGYLLIVPHKGTYVRPEQDWDANPSSATAQTQRPRPQRDAN